MNIYDFIYNQAFADACAENEHEFTDYERAYIIYKSYAPIRKKIDAYEFLIEHSEDEKLNNQLKKLIDSMNSYIEQMEEDDDIYAYAIYDGIENEWNLFDSFFDAKRWGLDKMVLKGGVSQNPTMSSILLMICTIIWCIHNLRKLKQKIYVKVLV